MYAMVFFPEENDLLQIHVYEWFWLARGMIYQKRGKFNLNRRGQNKRSDQPPAGKEYIFRDAPAQGGRHE